MEVFGGTLGGAAAGVQHHHAEGADALAGVRFAAAVASATARAVAIPVAGGYRCGACVYRTRHTGVEAGLLGLWLLERKSVFSAGMANVLQIWVLSGWPLLLVARLIALWLHV